MAAPTNTRELTGAVLERALVQRLLCSIIGLALLKSRAEASESTKADQAFDFNVTFLQLP